MRKECHGYHIKMKQQATSSMKAMLMAHLQQIEKSDTIMLRESIQCSSDEHEYAVIIIRGLLS